jgi:hypothetical protein
MTGTSNYSSTIMSKWITDLMKDCRIHNWRELANVSDALTIANKLRVPKEHVEGWIDHARDESLGEIMVELCDGNIEAVEILTERAKSGTPKDLAAWRSIPDLLLQQLQEPVHTDQRTEVSDSQPTREWMDVSNLSKWCHRAHKLLHDYEWLDWYATHVE